MSPRRRVVIAKVGLDGHDVGVHLVAKRLVEAGFEVIYLGKRVSTEQIVCTAIAEDVNAVGLSCLSGGLAHFATAVVQRLAEDQVDIPVISGGIDEPQEIEAMLRAGVYRHFGPSSDPAEIVEAFRAATSSRFSA